MGKISTEALAAVFRGFGFNSKANPPSDEAILKLGRANTSCKECLPLILTTGTLLNYAYNVKKENEVFIYFMPTGSGPCRFGQYYIFMEDLVERLEIPDVALFSLTSESSYAGLGKEFQIAAWFSIIISDVMSDIRSMILADAKDPEEGMRIFNEEWNLILKKLETRDFSIVEKQLVSTAENLRRSPLKRPAEEVPIICIIGEIFVRRDSISRQYLARRLAKKGFATVCTPVAEWILYSDYLVGKGLVDHKLSKIEKLEFIVKKKYMAKYDKRIKSILSGSGLVHAEPLNVEKKIENAMPYISPNLTGEAILTIGGTITEVASHVCGAIAIGPFGCMPNRLSEAVLNMIMNREEKLKTDPADKKLRNVLVDIEDLPFLAIESDGSPFPQLISAKLETFCLRSERLHRKMLNA
jgi:predicted nucleotide-binding protein (sugar kinase/HSP70/actin superfamily)